MYSLIFVLGILLGGIISFLILNSTNKYKKVITPLSDADIELIKERISSLNGREFEVFTYKLYSLLGYQTFLTPERNDGGKDIVINKDGEKIFVECKHNRRSSNVGRPEAQKLCGAMMASNISKGIILTLNGANKNCYDFCKKIKGKTIKIDSIEVVNVISLIESSSLLDSYELLSLLDIPYTKPTANKKGI